MVLHSLYVLKKCQHSNSKVILNLLFCCSLVAKSFRLVSLSENRCYQVDLHNGTTDELEKSESCVTCKIKNIIIISILARKPIRIM